jgi:uncharacterized protein YecT (DUF1311 family)
MMRPLRLSLLLAGSLVLLIACDDGTSAETAASTARDSALAHDLRLASGDTAAPRAVRTVSASPGALGDGASLDSATVATASNVSATLPSAEGYIGPSCASPALTDQQRCLLGYLERSDAQLDRSYQALIGRLKTESGTRRGAEPPSVQRLRTAQRSWLVYRDDECRKRTVEQEGPLWAPVRAKCLSEYSALRARELEDALAKRKAVVNRGAPVKSKHASRAKRSRSSGRRG